MPADTYVLTNQKGGVGKSTTTYHVAREACRRGRRVLVVDLDPQGNITSFLAPTVDGEPLAEDTVGLADVLSRQVDTGIRDVIIPSIWEGVDLVPTVGESLGTVREELTIAGAGRESRLRQALAEVSDDYDLILIDCPPSLDQLTGNGLTAAQHVLIVTETRMSATSGLAKLLNTIDDVRDFYNPTLTIAGIIVNRHEAKTKTAQHWLAEIQDAAEDRGLPLLTPVVPKRTIIGDYPEYGRGLDEGDADARELADIYSAYLTTIEGAHA